MPKLIDKGFDKIVTSVAELRGVKVGLLASAADYEDGTSVVDVGVWNEFGTKATEKRPWPVPARPFMRVAADQAGKEMQALTDHVMGLLIDGRTDAEGMDNTIGRAWVDLIKKTITGFNSPPNAEKTVKRKGKNDPLMDTEHMRDSINFERL